MTKEVQGILDKYQIEYFINGDSIDIWRNGRNIKIDKNISNLDSLEIILDEFCIFSPISNKIGEKDFSEYFAIPKKGEYIAVKKLSNDSINMYSIKEFKEFRDNKIVCILKSGKESFYDFYQILNKDGHHPSTTFWFNSSRNRVLWAVIEKIFLNSKKGEQND